MKTFLEQSHKHVLLRTVSEPEERHDTEMRGGGGEMKTVHKKGGMKSKSVIFTLTHLTSQNTCTFPC